MSSLQSSSSSSSLTGENNYRRNSNASSAAPSSVESGGGGGGGNAVSDDPAVRRAVYNLYRGLLGTYNDKANDIVSALPAQQVREDQGVSKQLESMM
jgi:hypothetical protein